jgi:acylphosphatase
MIRRTVLYSGSVQGVGFRFNANREAESFDVTGYVRNLPDGRVELVAEGEREEVERYLAAVADRMARNIRDVQQSENPTDGHFHAFEIRY